MKRTSEPKRVAIYARVSTKSKAKGRRQQDTENQLAQLRQFTATKNWTIVHEYVDRVTGKHSDREQFQRLFADAAERRFDIVLFWSLDRFSREGAGKTFQHLERLRSNGVDWWSLKEEYLRSIGPFAEAVLAILAVIAKQERVRISERTLAGLEKAARTKGHFPGRPKVKVDIKRARAMRRRGLSFREIAQTMGVSPATVLHRLAE